MYFYYYNGMKLERNLSEQTLENTAEAIKNRHSRDEEKHNTIRISLEEV